MLRINCLSIGAGLFTLLFSLGLQAQETTTVIERTIVSPPPTAVCTTVAGHWQGNVWIEAHDVCRYENRTEGVAWVKDYWTCTAVDENSNCTSWVLVPGHWVTTLD